MPNPRITNRNGALKIRVTILCARNLAKRDLFRLPDPFVKVSVDGTGQTHTTDSCRNTLDPKWNQHYDLYISKTDAVTISVWNDKKVHKKSWSNSDILVDSQALQMMNKIARTQVEKIMTVREKKI